MRDCILNRVNITDVIHHYLGEKTLRMVGSPTRGEYICKCPFHNERTPSFTITEIKQFCHCFGCGFHENAIGFIMHYENINYIQAVIKLVKFSKPKFHISNGKTKPTRARRRNRNIVRNKKRWKNRQIMHWKQQESCRKKHRDKQKQSHSETNCKIRMTDHLDNDDEIPF